MLKRHLFILILTGSMIFLVACQASTPEAVTSNWKPAEVRLLDEIDSTQPELELVALYSRQLGDELQVRLDFLDLTDVVIGNLYLAIDHVPGGLELPSQALPSGEASSTQYLWDTYIEILESGEIHAFQVNPAGEAAWQLLKGTAIRIVRNPQIDAVEISLARSSLGTFVPNSRIQAWVTPEDSQVSVDQAGPVLWNATSPRPLRVLFAFNHVFPAYTPSQGLRRWDGAHSGPEGGRHGLYNLLRPARNARLPLLLLDLASPASLAALDYQGGLDLVRTLVQDGLVELASPLPETAELLPEPVDQHFLDENAAAQAAFELPASAVTFQPLLGAKPGFESEPIVLTYSPETPKIHGFPVLWNDRSALIQLPAWPGANDPQQASVNGLSLPWKELLAQAALQVNLGDAADGDRSYLLLGGSLPQSTWGQPASARAGIEYIYAHPWISIASPTHLLPGALMNIASWSDSPPFADANLAPAELLEALLAAPQNSASQSAWQAYRALFAPTFPPSPQLPLLRQEYLGETSILLESARWIENREPIADCSSDLDGDGLVECILSSNHILALFELEGGSLSHLFLTCPGEPSGNAYQVIGPSSQLITGLSDPMDWNLDQDEPGTLPADPGVYAGALSGPQGKFQAQISSGALELTSQDGQITKRYQLAPNGLHVEIRSQFPAQLPGQMVVPVLIEPAASHLPGRLEQYQSTQAAAEIAWRINEQVRLVLHTINDFEEINFLDSRDLITRTEDPNFAYPQGHTLPFPLILVQINPEGNLFLDFQLDCE